MHNHRKRTTLTSGEIAKTRAGLTVSADRLDCDPKVLPQMCRELTDVLSKYINTDDDEISIRITFFYRMKRGISDVKTIQIK
ncbi:MAG: cell division topological specificity factor MinE [Clostridiales bacterium]|nr:cell division topological specificity factor MinE [Clostridiales bacterium]